LKQTQANLQPKTKNKLIKEIFLLTTTLTDAGSQVIELCERDWS